MLRYVAQIAQSFRAPLTSACRQSGLVAGRRFSAGSQNQNNYQSLESRNLLAGISFDSGVVTVIGTESNDISIVSVSSATQINVSLNGFATQTFTTSAVSKLVFLGLGGDDFFRNQTNLPVQASGGDGNDRLIGGGGGDLMSGGAGDDFLFGGDGNDTLIGNDGIDRLFGEFGDDLLVGNAGVDWLYGADGDDSLLGGDGNDNLFGGRGNDDSRGMEGDDYISDDEGNDFFDGGNGNDFVNAGDGADIILGGDGDDLLRGGEGNDRIEGLNGNDRLIGGGGDDQLFGGLGEDFLSGGAGADFLDGNEGIDNIFGGAGNDQIFGSDGSDRLFGDEGDDEIYGGFGLDTIGGGAGNDRLFGEAQADTIFGDAGNDWIYGGEQGDSMFGGDGNDTIDGQGGNDLLFGQNGNDELHGGLGDDQLFGNNGDDRLYGEAGSDILRGHAGDDALVGGVDTTDFMVGNQGKDRYVFFGADRIIGAEAEDARIEFRNASNGWTNAELEIFDDGFQLLHDATGNTRLLRGTLTQQPLVFIKEFVLAPVAGRVGNNTLATINEEVFNPATGLIDVTTRQEHQIQFGDWDEFNTDLNNLHIAEVLREVGYNWASTAAVSAVLPNQAAYFNSFIGVSGWTSNRPAENAISFYDVSPDGRWFFFRTALMTDQLARTNPSSDFASTFQFSINPFIDSTVKAPFVEKLSRIEDLFSRLNKF